VRLPYNHLDLMVVASWLHVHWFVLLASCALLVMAAVLLPDGILWLVCCQSRKEYMYIDGAVGPASGSTRASYAMIAHASTMIL
jgi:hypothetical protein